MKYQLVPATEKGGGGEGGDGEGGESEGDAASWLSSRVASKEHSA